MQRVEAASLPLGEQLGDGGQARVFAVNGRPDVVFKRYHDPARAAGIPQLLADSGMRAQGLTARGRPLSEWTAWPHTQVTEQGAFVGVLMPRIPDEFTVHIGGKQRLADLSYLATEPKPIWGAVSLPDAATRLEILDAFCAAVDALHERGLVIGDMSFGNVLWSVSPRPRVMLIDCDSIRPESSGSQHLPDNTPDWNDPHAVPGIPPDRDRDRYKLALAMVRVLYRSISIRPGEHGGVPADIPDHVAQALGALETRAAGPRGTRPSAREWQSALNGRRMIDVTRPQVRVGSAPPPKPHLIDRPGPRRTIAVRPPMPA